jgi:hypothetical protein
MVIKYFYFFFTLIISLASYSSFREGIDLFNQGDYERAKGILVQESFNDNIRAQLYLLASQGFEHKERSDHLILGLKTLLQTAVGDTRHADHIPALLVKSFWNLYSENTIRASVVLVPQVKRLRRIHTHHQRVSGPRRSHSPGEHVRFADESEEEDNIPLVSSPAASRKEEPVQAHAEGSHSIPLVQASSSNVLPSETPRVAFSSRLSSSPALRLSASRGSFSEDDMEAQDELIEESSILPAVGLENLDIREILNYVKGDNFFPLPGLFDGTPSEEEGEKELRTLVKERNHHAFYFLGAFYLNDKEGNSPTVIAQRKGQGLGAIMSAARLDNTRATEFCKQFLKLDAGEEWTQNCKIWCGYGVPAGDPRVGCGGDSSGSWWNCGLGLCGFKTRWNVAQLCAGIRSISRTSLEHIVMTAGFGLLVLQQLESNEVVDLGDGAARVAGLGGVVAALGAYLSAQNNPRNN